MVSRQPRRSPHANSAERKCQAKTHISAGGVGKGTVKFPLLARWHSTGIPHTAHPGKASRKAGLRSIALSPLRTPTPECHRTGAFGRLDATSHCCKWCMASGAEDPDPGCGVMRGAIPSRGWLRIVGLTTPAPFCTLNRRGALLAVCCVVGAQLLGRREFARTYS